MINQQFEYAGFWRRVGAYLLDILILSPIMVLSYSMMPITKYWYIYSFLPMLIFGYWYSGILVAKYGGTPGKLILGIKIIKIDGAPIKIKEATIRLSVEFLLTSTCSLVFAMTAMGIPDTAYYNHGWQERSKTIAQNLPGLYTIFEYLTGIWVWSEFFIMLTNKKKRAIHDFIAGTIVVRKEK